MTIKLPNEVHGETLFNKKEITIDPGITILVGCNGAGKSSLLTVIKQHCDNNSIPVLSFDSIRDADKIANRTTLGLVRSLSSSEGEKLRHILGSHASSIGYFIKTNNGEKVLLFDAVDSGASIDNIIDLKDDLFNTALKMTKDLYIVCAANSYEMVKFEKCLDVNSGNYLSFSDYEDFRSFIIKSRELKDQRYNK